MLQHVSEEERHLDILCLRLFTVELYCCIDFKAITIKSPVFGPLDICGLIYFSFSRHTVMCLICVCCLVICSLWETKHSGDLILFVCSFVYSSCNSEAIICKSILVSWSRFFNSFFFVCLFACLFVLDCFSLVLWSWLGGKPSYWNDTQPKMKGSIMSKQTVEAKDELDRVTKTVNMKSWAVSLCLVLVNSLDPMLTADQQAPSGYCKHMHFSRQDPCPYWMLKALSQKPTLLRHKSLVSSCGWPVENTRTGR